jgi:type IV pilus assembly protein PilE
MLIRSGCGLSSRWQAGMTLIELLVTLAIVAILASAAAAAYESFMQEARRADAVTGLLELAEEAEGVYLAGDGYRAFQARTSRGGHYRLSLAIEPGGEHYRASAVPLMSGRQRFDDCGAFWLDSRGRRGVSGSGKSVEVCWKQ